MSVEIQKHGTFEIWDVLKTGEGRGMSLPQYFIAKPYEFLNEFLYADEGIDHDHGDQKEKILWLAEGMISNIGHIHLPNRLRGKASVVEIIDPPRPYYFEIMTFERIKETYSSFGHTCSISHRLDFVTPHFDGVGPDELKHAVNHMIDAYEGLKASLWEKWQCEAFFCNKRNFLAQRERAANSYELLQFGSCVGV